MTRVLIRLVNWLLFRAWPRACRWLWLLYRVALVVALVLALLVTVCQQGQRDRPEDTGPPPWTTRVWAAEHAGGITIRANTGRATPDHRPPTLVGKVLFAGLLLLLVLALGAASVAVAIVCHGTLSAVLGLGKVRTGWARSGP